MKLKDLLEYPSGLSDVWERTTKAGLLFGYSYRLKLRITSSENNILTLIEDIVLSKPMVDMEGISIHRGTLFHTHLDDGFSRFEYDGIKGWVGINLGADKVDNDGYNRSVSTTTLEFYLPNAKAREKLRELLVRKHDAAVADRNGISVYTDSDVWWERSQNKVPKRSMDTIFMPEELKAKIINKIDAYIESAAEYEDKEIPRHFGICFHGPAGTGKSSLIAALAHKYDRDIYYPDPSTLEKGSTLTELFGTIRSGSLLVLEDFDTISSVKSREDKKPNKNQFMLSKFLNVMDGIVTPKDLMFIITTNHYASLDDALKRPGRINLEVEMPYLTQKVFDDITHHFYGPDITFDFPVEGKEITAASVTNMFASFFGDPEAGLNGLVEYLSEKR